MVHSVSGWTRGVQVKLWDPLRRRVPYLSALEVCSRRGAIQIHVYLTLYVTWLRLADRPRGSSLRSAFQGARGHWTWRWSLTFLPVTLTSFTGWACRSFAPWRTVCRCDLTVWGCRSSPRSTRRLCSSTSIPTGNDLYTRWDKNSHLRETSSYNIVIIK